MPIGIKMHNRSNVKLLCLALAAAARGLVLVPSRPQRGRPLRAADEALEPAEGDVVAYRVNDGAPLQIGVVIAEMSCTQWIQPLVVHEAFDDATSSATDELVFFEDETVETAVQVQGGVVAVIDAAYGQLPIPSLGGGVGYGAPAVDCYSVRRGDLPADVVPEVSEQGMAPWTH
mmetsp:Transcript_7540/g.31204  ORF Transcript_7540/g.31204 Transcript_7540/m.31204 type:complete len:174 (-) Transcript_7540:111-632(-)